MSLQWILNAELLYLQAFIVLMLLLYYITSGNPQTIKCIFQVSLFTRPTTTMILPAILVLFPLPVIREITEMKKYSNTYSHDGIYPSTFRCRNARKYETISCQT